MTTKTIRCYKVDLLHLQPQEAADIPRLLDCYASDPMGGGEPLKEYTRIHLIEELQKRSNIAHVFLAQIDGESVGLANCFEGFSTFNCMPLINIHDLVVLNTHRGHGIGKLLLNTVEEYARSIGCCKLTLEVLEGNTRAREVYKAVGFDGYELDPETGKAMFLEKKLV
jgi:GNAT superfamily N-acetyltransferase